MINKNLPTKLFLNGPELSFTTHPGNVTTSSGIATFTGIATATFPSQSPSNPGVSDGSISFEWYYDGNKITSQQGQTTVGGDQGKIETVGTASTLTLSGLDGNDAGKQVYAVATYNPTAYSQPAGTDVTVGSARSTGDVNNEPFRSNSATISILPVIQINSHPQNSVLAAGLDHNFSVGASIFPGGTGSVLSYQWQLNGTDLTNGVTQTTVTKTTGNRSMSVTDDATGVTTTIDFTRTSFYNAFTPGKSYTLIPSGNITVNLDARGGGGGSSVTRNASGGAGGRATGRFTFLNDQVYKLLVGEAGPNGSISSAVFPGGGKGGQGAGKGGNGGGYTGLFNTSATQANAILIAAGGGGGSNDPAVGGVGGGTSGTAGGNGNRAGKAGTQSAGGAGGFSGTQGATAGSAGSALQGGEGGAGGGGGYYGGGGGQKVPTCCADGAGGGGSSYKSSAVSSGTLTTGQGGAAGANGSFSLQLISASEGTETVTITTRVSGATTPNLTLNSEVEGIVGVVRCKLTASGVRQSPVFSNQANYSNIVPRNLLYFEAYGTNSTATIRNRTLSETNDVVLSPSQIKQSGTTAQSLSSNDIAFYAPEKDIDVEMDIRAGRGSSSGSNAGGQGGYSRIRFTVEKGQEYIIRGLQGNGAIFLYRRASLFAVVGEGGNAGSGGRGGNGGGVNLAGQSGTGSNGRGGAQVPTGSLNDSGTWGGRSNQSTIYPGDSKATGINPGITVKCSKGVYYRNQGRSSCQNVGTTKFRLSNGTQVTNSASLTRGFKAGYAINSTGGRGNSNGSGNGGHGARGGQGSTTGGGGGGSGYTDGSVTVVATIQGGNNGNASIRIRLDV